MEAAKNRVILKDVRFSYPHLVAPRLNQTNNREEYTLRILIRKDDKESLSAIAAAINFCKTDDRLSKRFGQNGKIPARLEPDLYDGDAEANSAGKIPPENAGCYYMNLKSTTQPGLRDLKTSPHEQVTDESVIYAGSYGLVSFDMVPYSKNGKTGISHFLSNVVKTKDGEPFSAPRRTAEEDFSEFLTGENAETAQSATDELKALGL
jgi:hypothetical protein